MNVGLALIAPLFRFKDFFDVLAFTAAAVSIVALFFTVSLRAHMKKRLRQREMELEAKIMESSEREMLEKAKQKLMSQHKRARKTEARKTA